MNQSKSNNRNLPFLALASNGTPSINSPTTKDDLPEKIVKRADVLLRDARALIRETNSLVRRTESIVKQSENASQTIKKVVQRFETLAKIS